MPQKAELLTRRFRLAPISPDKVSDNWVRWWWDPLLMSQMNARVIKLSRADLQGYVTAAWKNRRMLIGIYTLTNADHVGLYEISVDQRHGNIKLDVMVEQRSYALSNVLSETDPVLLGFFAAEHRIEKAIAQVVETNTSLIRHFEATGWRKEGVLRQEHAAVSGDRRLDAVQFGRLLMAGE